MRYRIQVSAGLDDADTAIRHKAAKQLGVSPEQIQSIQTIRKSIDARRGRVQFNLQLAVAVCAGAPVKENAALYEQQEWQLPACGSREVRGSVVVIGAGPCGLFAAHTLAQAGFAPLVLERGQAVPERVRQVEQFFDGGAHDEQSNVLFGDGGAGAFSDGKLTSRGKDYRGRHVLDTFVQYGAPDDIRFMAKPHVGTDRMRAVISRMRSGIEAAGGRFVNGAVVDAIEVQDGCLQAVGYKQNGTHHRVETNACVLATGHSARDVYELVERAGLPLQSKPFAVGVRIEHRQQWLDKAQYGAYAGHPALGSAEYALTADVSGRGVYTFCMCPGGVVVPSVSEEGCLCVNGMSYRARDGQNANAAVIVQVQQADVGAGVLAGVQFQRKWERAAYELLGGYTAPVQRLEDFAARRVSSAFGEVLPSYPRGTGFADLHGCLPGFVAQSIEQALPMFDKKLRGFAHPDAILTGVEMRSSAPVRILRDETLQSPAAAGLYLAGEGAGYAGGIVSAAVDGIKAAEQIVRQHISLL